MYNQNYDDYIRNVMGYPLDNSVKTYDYNNIYDATYRNTPRIDNYQYGNFGYNNFIDNYQNNFRGEIDLESLYPEIYKIVNPMVQKVCNENIRLLNEESINDMVETIYNVVEASEITENRSMQTSENKSRDTKTSNKQECKIEESVGENRQGNFLLRDLIKILLIKELIKRPRRPEYNPPMPVPPAFNGPTGMQGRPQANPNANNIFF